METEPSSAGVGNLRAAGHIQPTRQFGPAHEAIRKYIHKKLIQEKWFQMCNKMPPTSA